MHTPTDAAALLCALIGSVCLCLSPLSRSQNKEFVCRGNDYERLEAFQQRMLSEFPHAIAMQHANPPDQTILQAEAQCIPPGHVHRPRGAACSVLRLHHTAPHCTAPHQTASHTVCTAAVRLTDQLSSHMASYCSWQSTGRHSSPSSHTAQLAHTHKLVFSAFIQLFCCMSSKNLNIPYRNAVFSKCFLQ